jgi:tetratricopeptide (TPR) repeat protein
LEIKTARNWYWWLWLSPLVTIPTLLILYESDVEYTVRHVVGWAGYTFPIVVLLLLSALWHLILFAPALNKTSDFIRWHGRQALLLAGIRTAVPICMVLFTGDEYGALYAIPILIIIWLIGTIWGQRQAARGDCSLIRWFGQDEALPSPELVPEPVQDIDRDPDVLVDVIRFSHDPQQRRAALMELEKLGMVERLDGMASYTLISTLLSTTEDEAPGARSGGGYAWLMGIVVLAVLLGASGGSSAYRSRSAAATRQARAPTSAAILNDLANKMVYSGITLAKQGDIEEALSTIAQAQAIDPSFEISANSWNDLCYYGSLWGYAVEVMDACETAVALAPEHGGMRNSRGVARAIMGDYTGAIDDFTFCVEWAKGKRGGIYIQKREAWITELENGRNPFDAELLESLK